MSKLLDKCGKGLYAAFFLVVHLMKLHSISLMWGVTSEAMEYEERAEMRAKRREREHLIRANNNNAAMDDHDHGKGYNSNTKQGKGKSGKQSR